MNLPPTLGRLLVALLILVSVSACGIGTRYVFSSSRQMVATPDQRGLVHEEIWFSTADGVRLHGWLIPGNPDQPLVLFFHGNAANISHRIDNLQHLHGLGFPVFIFDYRGYGRSEGRPKGEADLGEDARGALYFLAQRGWQSSSMIYFGRSMGAAVALALALEKPPAGLVLEAPFTSLPEIARHMTPLTWALLGWWSIGDHFNNLQRIDQLRAPLLIFHGDRDAVIPTSMSPRLFARAPHPKTLHIVAGGGHSDCYLAGGEAYRQAWLDFAASLPSFGMTAAGL